MNRIKTLLAALLTVFMLSNVSAQEIKSFQVVTSTAPGQFSASGDSLFTFTLIIELSDTTGITDTSKVLSFDVKMQDKKDNRAAFTQKIRMEKDPVKYTAAYKMKNGLIYIRIGNYPVTRNYDVDITVLDGAGVKKKEMQRKF